jgi:hypothetical protein
MDYVRKVAVNHTAPLFKRYKCVECCWDHDAFCRQILAFFIGKDVKKVLLQSCEREISAFLFGRGEGLIFIFIHCTRFFSKFIITNVYLDQILSRLLKYICTYQVTLFVNEILFMTHDCNDMYMLRTLEN